VTTSCGIEAADWAIKEYLMPQAIRIWEIKDNILYELPRPQINLEARLEQWLESDISMIADDFLVIGRQVRTDFDGYIDLLCLDSRGDTVIIELKRGRTPREVTAQSLNYASWVKGLSRESIGKIADEYLGERGPLEEAFRGRFGEELPEILNESHRMTIVAEEMDDSTERIVRYLSDAGIGINVATVQHFQTSDGQEMLAQVFLIEPVRVAAKVQSTSKRSPNLSYEKLQAIAEEKGVGTLYSSLVNGLEGVFDQRGTTVSSIAFRGRLEGSIKVIFGVFPGSSDSERGLHFQAYTNRLVSYLGMTLEEVYALLPADREEWAYWSTAPDDFRGYAGYFKSMSEVQSFVEALKSAKAQDANP
jgi:hypothetical protein